MSDNDKPIDMVNMTTEERQRFPDNAENEVHDEDAVMASKESRFSDVIDDDNPDIFQPDDGNDAPDELDQDGAPGETVKSSVKSVDFTSINSRPAVVVSAEVNSTIKDQLKSKKVLAEIINNSASALKREERYKEDNLCNFRIQSNDDLVVFADITYRKIMEIIKSNDKKGVHFDESTVTAWAYDNLKDMKSAQTLLLEVATEKVMPTFSECGKMRSFANQKFADRVYDVADSNVNCAQNYKTLHKKLNELRKAIPGLELILKFRSCNEDLIDDAIAHFGETRLPSLNKAMFWDTFNTPEELKQYMETVDGSICPDVGADEHFTVAQIQKAVFLPIVKTFKTKLLKATGTVNVKEEIELTPQYCLSNLFEVLYSIQREDLHPKEEVLRTLFLTKIKYQTSKSAEENNKFYTWLREVVEYYHDTSMQKCSDEFFDETHKCWTTNVHQIQELSNALRDKPIRDLGSLQEFLQAAITWLKIYHPVSVTDERDTLAEPSCEETKVHFDKAVNPKVIGSRTEIDCERVTLPCTRCEGVSSRSVSVKLHDIDYDERLR